MGCIYSKGGVSAKNKSGHQLVGTSTTYDVVKDGATAGLISEGNEENAAANACLKFILGLNGYNERYGLEFVKNVLLLGGASGFQEKQISASFEDKPQWEQEHILRYIYINWHTLQQSSSLIEALKETNFVTSNDATGVLYKPKDLFDPGDSLLKSVFSGEAHKFPGGRFASVGWLQKLRKTGLRNTSDAETVLECARRVALLGALSVKPSFLVSDDPADFIITTPKVSDEIWFLAKTLVTAIIENFTQLCDNNTTNFCNIFGKIACIPAKKGYPFESGCNGIKKVLCSYSEAILLKDWPLAWSAAPIISLEILVPPEYSWEALQLKTPPPFSIVLKHLQAEVRSESTLLKIEEATFEVLEYLDRIWGTLSSSDKAKLQNMSLIPVANATRVVSPSCLYSCPTTIDTAPLAFELPSRYLPFVKILKEIGLHEKLSTSCAVLSLLVFQKRCGYDRLTPNELRAVLKILHFLCNEIIEQKSDISDWKSLLVVPDDGCRLVDPNSCVYFDPYGSQYLKYVDTSKLRFVHRDVSERFCIAFGIRKLSDVIVEVLDCVEHLPSHEKIASVSTASIKQKLLSRSFQVVVSRVFNTVASSHTGSEILDFQTLQKSLESVAKRLQFVQTIRTHFWLLPKSLDVTHVYKESFIHKQKNGSSHRALYYVDPSNTCMLIAEPPSFVSVFDLVAIVVSHVLGSPVSLPIGALFRCLKDCETALPNLLSDHERVMNSVDCGFGFLGRKLHPDDAKKARVNPLRVYKGEIVAWKKKRGDELKYGRILVNKGPTTLQENYKIRIETFPGEHKTIISSLVYFFDEGHPTDLMPTMTFNHPYRSRRKKYVRWRLVSITLSRGSEFVKEFESVRNWNLQPQPL